MTAYRVTVLTLGWVLLGALSAHAQEQSQSPHPGPVNLKVLPKDMPVAGIGKLMKRFEADLGVSCSHCHVGKPADPEARLRR